MESSYDKNSLVELQLKSPAVERDGLAANHAPARDPEVWDERIPKFNPLLNHTPEAEPIQLSPAFANESFDVESYLAEERAKDLLRFSTAGSVDDGKSTLIGRLLYDTASVYDDQIRSIEGKGTTAPGVLDLALLTDGLRAEREQGITIDVAYRYFATSRRKFIIADTPGHEQYTRNMATGASTADLAIVLVDARKGVLPQSRRHAAITVLLGVRHVVIAVNKMDLVGYDQGTFDAIERDFRAFFVDLASNGIGAHGQAQLHFLPVSALAGDNVVRRADAMPWYTGPALLELLESIPSAEYTPSAPFRLAVQRVARPNLDFRGFAGQISSGTIRPGDVILAQPSGQRTTVTRIVTFDGDLSEAAAPLSVTLTLADEIDISRGDLLTTPASPATLATRFSAALVWMSELPLIPGARLLLKHTSRTVQAEVRAVSGVIDLTAAAILPPAPGTSLSLNGIAIVSIEARLPLTFDSYTADRHTGSFVLIDLLTNATVAAGMIRSVEQDVIQPSASIASASASSRVTSSERANRFGHSAAHLLVRGPLSLAEDLERTLFVEGVNVMLLEHRSEAHLAPLLAAGFLVLTHETAEDDTAAIALEGTDFAAVPDVRAALAFLRQHRILHREETA